MGATTPGLMLIRAEVETDRDAVFTVHAAAFEGPQEARLVEVLRTRARPIISLVAEESGSVEGHILFTPVSLAGFPGLLLGLGPMAVAPEHQRCGIGSALVRAGLERCVQLEAAAVVVVGHPEYYPRFGFSAATRFGVDCEYDVPAEAFMVLELQPGSLRGASGTINYHPAFNEL